MNSSKYFFIFSLLILCVSLVGCFTFGYNKQNLKVISDNGTKIIEALEKYRNDNGEYPENIVNLTPKYIKNVQTTGVKPFGISIFIVGDYLQEEEEYIYWKSKVQDKTVDPVEYGYQLMANVDRFTFMMLDDEQEWRVLVYRPSKKYPDRECLKFLEQIGDWAVMVRYTGFCEQNMGSKYN